MKYLVVGASGFVGKVLCQQLHEHNFFTRAMIRKPQVGSWNEAVVADLADFAQQEEKIFSGIDTVFYLASVAHHKAAVADYQKINVDYCLRFAECALKHGVKRFVYISSSKAMAGSDEKIVDETFLDEPSDAYGVSKRQAERGLLAMQGFEHLVIVRPCLIYGVNVRGNLQAMIHAIDQQWFPSLPESHARRSMISVNDVARALIAVAQDSKANRQIYLLTDGQQYSVSEMEKAIRRALGQTTAGWPLPKPMAFLLNAMPGVSPLMRKLTGAAQYSSRKIEQELGWRPSETFYAVLPDIIRQYRDDAAKRSG